MASDNSVSGWLIQLQAGDQDAARPLWERYFRRLVGLARKKLQDLPRRAVDEEDVALSAFDSFCRRAEHGQFPHLHDRDDLWRLLFVITERKAKKLVRDQTRQKRGGGEVRGDSVLDEPGDSSGTPAGFDQFAGDDPTPDFAAQVAEECERLLGLLGAGELLRVAVGKMEGRTNEEIAAAMGCAVKTVDRKLKVIRHRWEQYAPS